MRVVQMACDTCGEFFQNSRRQVDPIPVPVQFARVGCSVPFGYRKMLVSKPSSPPWMTSVGAQNALHILVAIAGAEDGGGLAQCSCLIVRTACQSAL